MTENNKEMIILKSNILRPGEKFEVTDRSTDGKFLPGSTGFISFVKGVDQQFSNVAHFLVVVTKKGKSGKERIETADMSAPIFEVVIPGEELILPGPERRFFTRIEHIINNVDNVCDMPTYDFMGWILARAKFIQKLSSKSTYVKLWPQSKTLNDVLELTAHFSGNPAGTKEYYAREDIIDDVITVLNKTESRAARCAIGYMYQTAILEMKAARNLFDFYANRTTTQREVLDVLNNTTMYYGAKSDILNRLYKFDIQAKHFTDQMKIETTAMLGSMLYTAM